MRLTSVNMIRPGEKNAVSIYASNGSRVLSEGYAASDFVIAKLKQMGIKYTYIEDERFPEVTYKDLLGLKTVTEAVKTYKASAEAVSKGKEISEEALKEVSKLIADDIKSSGTPINIINASYSIESPLAAHAVRTAAGAAAMGIILNYNFGQLCDLSLAGLIHDIGRDDSTGEEDKAHPEKGFEVLRKYRLLNLNSSIVAYQHHESFDGTGFPRGQKGADISEFTRIVSIVDYFETLTSGQSGTSLSFENAYNEVLNESGKRFDPDMVKVFQSAVQIFNNGTVVILNNGKQGIVVSQNAGLPLRPNIRLFSDSLPEYSEDIDLSKPENKELTIQKVEL